MDYAPQEEPMRARTIFSLIVVLVSIALARPARASVNMGLGADWLNLGVGELNLTLGADTTLAGNLSLGGRAGAAIFGESGNMGIPMDLLFKLRFQRTYFEFLAGPWVIFDAGDLFYFHGAFGFGLESAKVAFGLELGLVGPANLIGLRVVFKL
jgi:hypothetical protein